MSAFERGEDCRSASSARADLQRVSKQCKHTPRGLQRGHPQTRPTKYPMSHAALPGTPNTPYHHTSFDLYSSYTRTHKYLSTLQHSAPSPCTPSPRSGSRKTGTTPVRNQISRGQTLVSSANTHKHIQEYSQKAAYITTSPSAAFLRSSRVRLFSPASQAAFAMNCSIVRSVTMIDSPYVTLPIIEKVNSPNPNSQRLCFANYRQPYDPPGERPSHLVVKFFPASLLR